MHTHDHGYVFRNYYLLKQTIFFCYFISPKYLVFPERQIWFETILQTFIKKTFLTFSLINKAKLNKKLIFLNIGFIHEMIFLKASLWRSNWISWLMFDIYVKIDKVDFCSKKLEVVRWNDILKLTTAFSFSAHIISQKCPCVSLLIAKTLNVTRWSTNFYYYGPQRWLIKEW